MTDLRLTTVPRDLYYVERKLVVDQAAEIERLRGEVAILKNTLAGISEYCSGEDRPLGAIERLATIRNTADRTLRALAPAEPLAH